MQIPNRPLSIAEKLCPKSFKAFQYELAANLAAEWDVRDWRLRRVERIKSIDGKFYHQKTSFQFLIPSERILKVIRILLSQEKILTFGEQGYLSRLKQSDIYQMEIPLLIPLDRFSKRILLEFSLKDSNEKPLSFLTRYQSSLLGYFSLRTFLKKILTIAKRKPESPEANTLKDFISSQYKILMALVFMSNNELKINCEKFGLRRNFKTDFSSVTEELERYKIFLINQLQMEEQDFSPLWGEYGKNVREILVSVSKIQEICRKTADLRCEAVSPALNPLMLIGDYFLLHGQLDFPNNHFKDFLDEASQYTTKLLNFCESAESDLVKAFIGRLNIALSSYLGFFETNVKLDSPFIIKYEQIISGGLRNFGWIGYGINLGYEKSWHLEIIRPSTLEFDYKPEKSYIELEGIKEKFKPLEILGGDSEASKDRHHFYKNRTWQDIDKFLINRKSLSTLKEGPRPAVTLWTKVGLNCFLRWSHWLGFLIVLMAALMFGYWFEFGNSLKYFEGGNNEGTTPIFWITLAGPLVVFFMTVREKEIITVQLLEGVKRGILNLVGLMYGYLFLSILWEIFLKNWELYGQVWMGFFSSTWNKIYLFLINYN